MEKETFDIKARVPHQVGEHQIKDGQVIGSITLPRGYNIKIVGQALKHERLAFVKPKAKPKPKAADKPPEK